MIDISKVNLLTLSTGEYILAVMLDYNFTTSVSVYKPKQLVVTNTYPEENTNTLQTNVSLINWPQFSTSEYVEITYSNVVSIVTPEEKLVDLYQTSLND